MTLEQEWILYYQEDIEPYPLDYELVEEAYLFGKIKE